MKVLIIDDDDDALNIMSASLKSLGIPVYQARDGSDGLRLAERVKPNVIILDVVLQDMSGWEVCRQVRSTSDVPILMVSGFARESQDEAAGLEAGADDYLRKPIDSRLLRAHVENSRFMIIQDVVS